MLRPPDLRKLPAHEEPTSRPPMREHELKPNQACFAGYLYTQQQEKDRHNASRKTDAQ